MKLRLAPGISFILSIVFLSCKSPQNDNEEVLKFVSYSLISSTENIEQQNATLYTKVREKFNDAATSFRARIWEPKALAIKKHADQLTAYLRNPGNRPDVSEDQLWLNVTRFKDSLLTVDTFITMVYENEINSFPKSYDSSALTETFIKTKLSTLSPTAAKAFIKQMISQVRIMENRLVNYCWEQCLSHSSSFDNYYSAIIGQSSSVVGPKEEIKITAGMGAFTRERNPIITINGKQIEISGDGAAYYKFKAPARTGRYTIPTKIEYTDQDGKQQWIIKTVEYTVVKR